MPVRGALAASGIAGLLLALARPAEAVPYETFIDIGDQADLEDLFAAGDITQDTFEELLELFYAGVDLSTADRATLYALPNLTYEDVDAILKYREQNQGAIEDPGALVAAGVLSEDKLLAISAFLVVTTQQDRYNVKGWIRAMARYGLRDRMAPPMALRGRLGAMKHLQAGFAGVFTRLQVGAPQYDPARDALIADPAGYGVTIPKAYVKYEDDEATFIAGTYRIGFGQRLVFDNSGRYTPNGIYFDDTLFFGNDLVRACRESAGELDAAPCDASEGGDRYVAPDWGWRDGLLGAAAGFKKLELGGQGWLQGYVWASAQKRRIYQYELVDRGKCEDPSQDNDPACRAPDVFVRPEGDLLSPTSRFSFVTLPDVFQERLAGLHAAYYADRRNSVGLTAYYATETNLVDGIDLDTQEWSRIPTGRRYGAAGASFSFGRDWFDLFGEAAFSYDQLPDTLGPQEGGGGPAAILRMTATKKKQELEASFRYLGVDFVNPYARPIAQPDELDGQRARDELGFRVRYYRTDKRYSIRALVDLWENPSQRDASNLGRAQPKIDTYLRGDLQTSKELRLGLWLRYQDKDLRPREEGGPPDCFSVSTEFDENGEPIACGGKQITTIARARYQPNKQFAYTAMFEHQLLDDPTVDEDGYRRDLSGWLIALWTPRPGTRVRARLRYLEQALGAKNMSGADQGETSISGLVDTAFRVRDRDTIRARIDFRRFLDDRASTLDRDPNPEVSLWLSYEARL